MRPPARRLRSRRGRAFDLVEDGTTACSSRPATPPRRLRRSRARGGSRAAPARESPRERSCATGATSQHREPDPRRPPGRGRVSRGASRRSQLRVDGRSHDERRAARARRREPSGARGPRGRAAIAAIAPPRRRGRRAPLRRRTTRRHRCGRYDHRRPDGGRLGRDQAVVLAAGREDEDVGAAVEVEWRPGGREDGSAGGCRRQEPCDSGHRAVPVVGPGEHDVDVGEPRVRPRAGARLPSRGDPADVEDDRRSAGASSPAAGRRRPGRGGSGNARSRTRIRGRTPQATTSSRSRAEATITSRALPRRPRARASASKARLTRTLRRRGRNIPRGSKT